MPFGNQAQTSPWINEQTAKGGFIQFAGKRYEVGQNLPIEEEAERAYLGIIILLSQNDHRHPDVKEFIHWIDPEDFYYIRHAFLHKAMQNIFGREEVIALDTLASELNKTNRFKEVGGMEYLSSLVKVTNLNLETYARMVKRASALRYIKITAQQIVSIDPADPISEVSSKISILHRSMQQRMTALAPNSVFGNSVLDAAVSQIVIDAANPTFTAGLRTGFNVLDNAIIGLRKKELMTVAAPAGWGKSQFTLNVAVNTLKTNPTARCLYIATEDDPDTLIERIISSEAGIEGQKLTKRELDADDIQRMMKAKADLASVLARLEICRLMMPSMQDVETRVMASMRDPGLDFVICDWLHYLTVNETGTESQVTAKIFSKLREMKAETNLPWMVATQMNRDYAKRADMRPEMSDLAWSSAIEQTSDIIMFVFLPGQVDEMESKEAAEWIFKKNRRSGVQTVQVRNNWRFSRFEGIEY